MTEPSRVYASILQVISILKKNGVGKDRYNQQQKFSYRGIDDIHNALAPALVEANLVMLPRVVLRECHDRKSNSGNPLYFVNVAVEYDIVSTIDGSKHTVAVMAEAMDSADKATNKALSMAFKYAAIQTFSIPVVGQDDADAGQEAPVSNVNPWTKDLLDGASAAAAIGYDDYAKWWGAQTQEFRKAAYDSTEHAGFKVSSRSVSAVKSAPPKAEE